MTVGQKTYEEQTIYFGSIYYLSSIVIKLRLAKREEKTATLWRHRHSLFANMPIEAFSLIRG